jgi:hypothetical protein
MSGPRRGSCLRRAAPPRVSRCEPREPAGPPARSGARWMEAGPEPATQGPSQGPHSNSASFHTQRRSPPSPPRRRAGAPNRFRRVSTYQLGLGFGSVVGFGGAHWSWSAARAPSPRWPARSAAPRAAPPSAGSPARRTCSRSRGAPRSTRWCSARACTPQTYGVWRRASAASVFRRACPPQTRGGWRRASAALVFRRACPLLDTSPRDWWRRQRRPRRPRGSWRAASAPEATVHALVLPAAANWVRTSTASTLAT